MEIINEFGIQPILLLAQVVNFVILLLILKRFLYKPILKVLEDRKQRIATSLKQAEEIEIRLQKIQDDQDKMMADTSFKIDKMLKEASQTADQIIQEAHVKATDDIKKMMDKSTIEMKQEKDQMFQEVKVHIADLVIMGFEKLAGKVLNQKDQKELIKKTMEEIKSA